MSFVARVAPLLGLVAMAAVVPTRALADDVDKTAQKAAAQALFESGRTLVEGGNFAEACPKFAESQRLDPGIGTLLWLADCYESSGRTASAWAGFKAAAASAALKRDDRERVARERAAALEPKLPHISIAVPPAAQATGLAVRRDGADIGSPEWGLPIPVDPGTHTVEATAPGRRPWSATVDAPDAGEVMSVTVPVLAFDAAEEQPDGTKRAPEGAAPRLRPTSVGDGQRIAGATVAGFGLAGVVAGTVLAFEARATYDHATSSGHCRYGTDECDANGAAMRKKGYSFATATDWAMGAGAVAVAGGAILFFTAPRRDAPAIGVVPSLRGASARVEWAW